MVCDGLSKTIEFDVGNHAFFKENNKGALWFLLKCHLPPSLEWYIYKQKINLAYYTFYVNAGYGAILNMTFDLLMFPTHVCGIHF